VWDVATGELLAQLDDGGSPAGFAAFASDGNHVITASRGGIVQAWDITWLARARDATLARSVCREKLLGTSSIVTAADVRDAPLLTGHVGEDACAGTR
jgi:WD40 repeat protein